MRHLDDLQLEETLSGRGDASGHLEQCPLCRQRLEELRALRARLQGAFACVTAPAALRARLEAATAAPVASVRRPIMLKLRRVAWPVAAAAAMLLAAVPFLFFFGRPSPAQASQQELVNIHRQNLVKGHEFYSEDEPARLAQYFKDKLGFAPAMPKLNQGMAIRGCCVAHFQGGIAGSYVVDTPHGVISIVVVSQTPTELGLSETSTADGTEAYAGSFATNQLAAVRIGQYTYCAVGEVSSGSLLELLGLLVR